MLGLHVTLTENGRELAVRVACEGVGETPKPHPKTSLQALSGLAGRAGRAVAATASPARLRRLGKDLCDRIFAAANRDLLLRALAHAEAREKALQVVVHCSAGSVVERLPWELLHDGRRFLAMDPRCSVVRYFDEPLPVRELAVAPPLRVLVTTASPPSLEELDLEAEGTAVREAYDGDRSVVEVTVAHRISLHRLGDLLRRARLDGRPFHVWHHCGHGGLVHGERGPEFRLFFEGTAAQPYANVEQLGTLIGQNPELRLAVVAACYGGSAFGLAPELARLSLPAVVGFPGRIADAAARRFSFVLHQCLPRLPIELAVGEARRAMLIDRPGTLDWALPLLFSRRTDRGPILEMEIPQAAGGPRPPARQPSAGRPPLAPVSAARSQLFSREEIAARESRLRRVVAELDQRLLRWAAGRRP